jgi:hypothetical protein
MIVSMKYAFAFVHVPKTGGTSIRHALKGIGRSGIDSRVIHGTQYQHRSLQLAYDSLHPSIFNALHKFAFIRDPWDYVASFFLYTERHNRLPKRNMSFKQWVLEPDPIKSVLQHKYCPHTVPVTRTPQLSFLTVNGGVQTDFIGKFERLEEDLRAVWRYLNLPGSPDLPRNNSNPNQTNYREMYDSETRDHVAHYFAPDIEYFNYSF